MGQYKQNKNGHWEETSEYGTGFTPYSDDSTAASSGSASSGDVLASLPSRGGDIHIGNQDPNTGEMLPAAGQQAAGALKKWQDQLPGYLQDQISGAQDQAKRNLAGDIQNTRASANARGLLYSGVEQGGESMDKAKNSSELASHIQSINAGAEDITTQRQNLAQQEALGEDQNQLSMNQMQVDMAQSSYELAMQEQQNQNSFFKDLFGGIGMVVGGAAGFLAGGPAGAVAGGSAGGAIGRNV